MNSIKKMLWLLPLIAMLIALVPFAVIADGDGNTATVDDGWSLDADGVQRYYINGAYVTGVQTIGGFSYKFASDGAYEGLHDAHKNVGVLNTNESEEYRNALKAIVSSKKKVYSYHTFDVGGYIDSGFKTPFPAKGALLDKEYATKETNNYTNLDGIFKSGGRFQLVQRETIFNAVKRGDGTAVQVVSSKTGTSHSYVNGYISGHKAGEPIVIEMDFRLGENYNCNSSVFQLIDRKNKDAVDAELSNVNYMPNLMTLNKDGGLYLNVDSNVLVALITEDEYTRVSIAIHPESNTFDTYINGLLVYSGAKFLTDATYKSENFQIDEFRSAQFSNAPDTGSLYIDNFAAYQADAPVCTVTAEPKNGFAIEGGVIRYYKNNLIALGEATANGTIGNYTFNNEKIRLNALNGAFYPGSNAEIIVNGAVSSSGVVPGNIFIAPDAVTPDKGVFGGWQIIDGGKSVLVSPGDIYVMSGDITCTATEMDLAILKGASIKTTSTDSTSLRFMGKVDRGSYEGLTSAGAKIETHMLLIPTEFFDETYGYHTVEALNKSGFEGKYTDITITSWYSTSERYNYFVGSVENITTADYAKKYSAVTYMVITYPNGAITTVYAPFIEEDNTRTVYEVAHAAYNDRTTLKNQESYGNKIKFGKLNTFSPYTAERLGVIKSMANRVITLDASGDEVVPAGAFYDAPYSTVTSFNSETGKNEIAVSSTDETWSISDALCVLYNGNELSAEEYTVDAVCTVTVDALKYELSELYTPPANVNSWYLIDPYMDYECFTSVNEDPQYISSDSSYGWSLHWPYTTGSFAISSAAVQQLGSKLNGKLPAYISYMENGTWYYDFSDWHAISFYVWSDTADQTFHLNFYSDDPSSEGADYYGRKFSLLKGWNHFVVSRESFGASRTPIGWDHINSINFTSTGWSQSPNQNTNLYFSEFTAYDSKDIATPFSDFRIANASVFSENGFYCGVDGNSVRISDGAEDSLCYIKNGVYYLPMGSIASVKGFDGVYYPDEGVLKFWYNNVDYVFTAGSKQYLANDEQKELTAAPEINGRALFFADTDVMNIFGYTQKYVDRMGFIALSNTENIFDAKADFNTIFDLIESMVYVRPKGEQIVSDLNAHSGGQHPYLMIDGEGFDRLRYYADMDSELQMYISRLESSYGIGTSKFNADVNRFALPDGQRLLSISRDVMNKTISWALLAKLYEVSDPERATQYAERIWLELEAAANYKDPNNNDMYSWHPQHFLDTGELGYPFGICYDWLYDYWVKTDDDVDYEQYGYEPGMTRRQIMEDAMYWMGLSATSALPSDTTGKYIPYNYNLGGSTNNWNGVCNGGLMAAALAICNVERYAENVETYLSNSILGVEAGMWVYAPDGGYEEGPGYWGYGTTYLQIFMSCLNSACGTNYGLYNAPGFARSIYLCTYLANANTTWGFHDGGSGSADTNISAWFAKESNDPNVNAIRRQAISKGWKGVSMYDIMYFDPHIMTSTITLELDAYYSLDSIMTFRSSWDTTNNIFAGLHGGDNAASHGDLDMGNFVINVNGKFVIMDLGSDEYNMPGYFGIYRWSYYRKRAEGQNTLVMIPSSENTDDKGWVGKAGKPDLKDYPTNAAASTNPPTLDQIKSAVSKTLRYESGTNSALGVVEMHPAFEQMTDGIRGMWFKDNRSTVVVQDEAVMSEDMDIWWFAHTQGEITVSEDGRSAIINYNGICLYAEIVTDMPEKATFFAMEANSLDPEYVNWDGRNEYYTGDIEHSRANIRKLTIRVDDCSELRLAVVFKVIEGPADAPQLGTTYQWTNIADWKVD